MSVPVLYQATLDLDCFAARLFLGVLALDYQTEAVDLFPGVDAQSRRYLADGPLPGFAVGEMVAHGLVAVFDLIATQSESGGRWLPPDGLASRVAALDAVADCRNRAVLGADDGDVRAARTALLVLEDELTLHHLRGQEWIVADVATALDLALYSRVALIQDFGLEFSEFPALRHWVRAVRMLAPQVSMPGILDPV
jgi:glutathione S-transferase